MPSVIATAIALPLLFLSFCTAYDFVVPEFNNTADPSNQIISECAGTVKLSALRKQKSCDSEFMGNYLGVRVHICAKCPAGSSFTVSKDFPYISCGAAPLCGKVKYSIFPAVYLTPNQMECLYTLQSDEALDICVWETYNYLEQYRPGSRRSKDIVFTGQEYY